MSKIDDDLKYRFGPDVPTTPPLLSQHEFPAQLAGRRSHRRFKPDPLKPELIQSLCALALCAPAKSDLQQRDIIIIEDEIKMGKRVSTKGNITLGSIAIQEGTHGSIAQTSFINLKP